MTETIQRIVVTGGAGFVGSHLVAGLAADPSVRLVVSLDDYSTGSRDNHIHRDNVVYEQGHTRDIARLQHHHPDLVYHLGEYARVERSLLEPARVWESNFTGTTAVLEFCREHRIPLVYAASSTRFAVDADGNKTDGRLLSPYTWSKAANADLVQLYGRWYPDRFRFAIAYLFNVYGPREISEGAHATVVGIFIKRYLAGLPLVVTSPGDQTRNFTHVDDTVRGLMQLRDHLDGQSYHLGHPKKYSIRELAGMFPGATIVMGEGTEANRLDATCDLTTAQDAFAWHPERELADYIMDLLAAR